MFPFPNPMSHVSSAAFAQAQLSFSSGLLRPAHPIHVLTRNHQL